MIASTQLLFFRTRAHFQAHCTYPHLFSVSSWIPLPTAILCLDGQALKGQASGHDWPDRKGPSTMLWAICQLLRGTHQPPLQWLAWETGVSALHKYLDTPKSSSGTCWVGGSVGASGLSVVFHSQSAWKLLGGVCPTRPPGGLLRL